MCMTDTELESMCFSLTALISRTVSHQCKATDPASTPTALGTENARAVLAGSKITAWTFSTVLEIEKRCKGPVVNSDHEREKRMVVISPVFLPEHTALEGRARTVSSRGEPVR